MKKLLLLLVLIAVFSCNKESEPECTCLGKFRVFTGGQTVYGNKVNCDNGEPMVTNQNEAGNPVVFLGCD